MKIKIALAILTLAAATAAYMFVLPVKAASQGDPGFGTRSLMGSYASSGRAGGYLSRSVGVTWFDGNGNVKRVVTINTSDGATGRKLLQVISTGTYTITPDGLGTIHFMNEFDTGTTSEVTFDFVISKSSRMGGRAMPLAEEITGIQREPGQTAALVEEFWTLRPGVVAEN